MSLRKPRLFALEVSPWAAIAVLILVAWSDSIFGSRLALLIAALVLGSLVVHELGHIAVAALHNVRVTAIGLSAAGTYIRRARARSRWAESVISLAGPMASLALAAIFALQNGHVCRRLAEINLVLALSNLIPAFGTDGDRALNALCAPSATQN